MIEIYNFDKTNKIWIKIYDFKSKDCLYTNIIEANDNGVFSLVFKEQEYKE